MKDDDVINTPLIAPSLSRLPAKLLIRGTLTSWPNASPVCTSEFGLSGLPTGVVLPLRSKRFLYIRLHKIARPFYSVNQKC